MAFGATFFITGACLFMYYKTIMGPSQHIRIQDEAELQSEGLDILNKKTNK